MILGIRKEERKYHPGFVYADNAMDICGYIEIEADFEFDDNPVRKHR